MAMFESLSERLEKSFQILKGEGRITEINIAETMKDVRKALLAADVNYKTAKTFTDEVKKKALGQNVITSLKPKELMIKIVHDELVALMGSEQAQVDLSGNPTVILMAGLQGAGKTTFAAKIAKRLKSQKGKRPLLVGADVYRPAAREQLRVLAEGIEVPVYTEEERLLFINAAELTQDRYFENTLASKLKSKDMLLWRRDCAFVSTEMRGCGFILS